MQKQRITAQSPKVLFFDNQISDLCQKISKKIAQSIFSSLQPDIKTLTTSLSFISTPQTASKAFSTLLSLIKHFQNHQDTTLCLKLLSKADQIIPYVKNSNLLTQYSKLKDLHPCTGTDDPPSNKPLLQEEFLQLINEPSFPFSVSSSMNYASKEKDYFKRSKRPSTAGKRKQMTCPTPSQHYSKLKSTTRPSSAKRPSLNRSGQFDCSEGFKGKTSNFQNSLAQEIYGKKRNNSEDFSQRIELLTPPKTPEGLIRLNILIESQKSNSEGLRKPLGVGKRQEFSCDKERAKSNDQKIRVLKKKFRVQGRAVEKVEGNHEKDKGIAEKMQSFQVKNGKKSQDVKKKLNEGSGLDHQKNERENFQCVEKNSQIIEKHFLRKCLIVKKIISEDYLAAVIKIQAFFRGYLAREKFSLIKNRKKWEKSLVLLLEYHIFYIKIAKIQDSFRVFLETNEKKSSFDLSPQEMQNFSKSKFFLHEGILRYSQIQKKATESFLHFCSCESVINGKTVDVFFSINKKKTIIKAELQDEEKAFELTIPMTENKEIDYFIRNSVTNYLTISEGQLKLDYPKQISEKVLVFHVKCKQSKKNLTIFIYKVISCEGSQVEICIIDNSTPSKLIFFIPEENFLPFFENSIFPHNNSFIYFFAIDYKTPGKILEKLNFRFIESIKKQISQKDLIFRCFVNTSNKKKYLFECLHPDQILISSLQLSQSEINSLFRVKSGKIESSIEMILNNFTLKENSLIPIPVPKISTKKLTQSVDFLKLLKKVQLKFRARFKRNKKALENLEITSVFHQSKKIQGVIFNFNVFKVVQGLIIEVFSDQGCLAYKLIKNPLRYVSALNKIEDLHKLIDATTVIDNKIVITRAHADIYADDPENSFYVETNFMPDEEIENSEWPIFLIKELNYVSYILKATIDKQKSLIVKLISLKGNLSHLTRKFTHSEIVKHLGIYDPKSLIPSLRISYGSIVTSDLVRYSLPAAVDELLNVHIISKIAVRQGISMYLICATFVENTEIFEESEFKFYAKLNSSLEGCRKTTIGLSQAASITGIDQKAILAIAEHISKNMVVINSDEFYIDCSRPPVVLDKFVAKLQALIRGYKARRKVFIKLVFLFKENFKIQGSSFTILVYALFNKNYLAAIKGFDVFKSKLTEGFMEKFYRAGNKKVFVFEEVLKNLKNSDKKFTFLKESESRSPLRRRPTIELAKASVVPNLMNILKSNTIQTNEDYELVTTFSITPNLYTFYVKVYQNESRTFLEILVDDDVLTKNIGNYVKDFESFAKLIHVDIDRKKIIIEEKCILNRIVFIDGKKASIIIFKNKNGYFLDGCTLDHKRPSFIYLGDNAKINSVMTKLRISSGKIVLSHF